MSDDVKIALITTLLGSGSILIAAFKIIPEVIKARKVKQEESKNSTKEIISKLDDVSTSINNLAPLIILSLQVHKVELQGIKDGGLNGDCEKWHKRIDEELEKMLINSVKLEDTK